jgi:hypothetical protein
MRKLLIVAVTTAAVVAFSATAAFAQNPHFLRSSAGVDNSGNLVGSFRIAGLGNNETITVTLSADATAQYACFNNGGKHPSATNKETVTAPVSASGEFTSGKNGSVTGTLSTPPPGPGDFTCPPGQTMVFTFVEYDNVSITADTAEGMISADVPGTFTFGSLV